MMKNDKKRNRMNAEELLHLLLVEDDRSLIRFGSIIDWDRLEATNPKLYHYLQLERIGMLEKGETK